MTISADLYDLYAEFGITSEKAQVLEVEAGNAALSYLALFVGSDDINPEERQIFKSVIADVNRKTLGAMLKHIKSIGKFDATLLQIVDEGLERRNYLTHSFFRSHNFAINDVSGRKMMVEELKEIQLKLDLAHGVLSAVTESLSHFAGRSGLAENLTERLLVQAKRVNI